MKALSLWRGVGAARLTLILVLLLTSSLSPSSKGGGGVTGQLYTVLEDVAAYHDLPLAPIPSDKQVATETTSRQGTCMVPFQNGPKDSNPNQAEEWAYYRTEGNQHRYFCVNIPKFGPIRNPTDRNGVSGFVGDRLQTPHARFWLEDPTAPEWYKHHVAKDSTKRESTLGTLRGLAIQEGKDDGFLFRIDVTGIESGGRFLKGWYHLKITLTIDHNIGKTDVINVGAYRKIPYHPSQFGNRSIDARNLLDLYEIEKLVVTARGRTLVPGRPKKGVLRPPRRAWVGGIGEFVKDFPKCRDAPAMNFVQQQFIPCGTVQYGESKYGNNFYYTRFDPRADYGHRKYGSPLASEEIHLNFRLDNSFCNRYYDLDFVATGMVSMRTSVEMRVPAPPGPSINPGGYEIKWVPLWKCLLNPKLCVSAQKTTPPPSPGWVNYIKKVEETKTVFHSISTRFTFASSYAHHAPDYYENADPIPRNRGPVTCTKPLKGEWVMSTRKRIRGTHRMSVTQGADLVLSGARPDSTFYGAIKFVTPVPTYPSSGPGFPSFLFTEFDEHGVPSGKDKGTFNARRTWTNSARMSISLVTEPDTNPWQNWNDFYGLSQLPIANTGTEAPHMVAAVQRVLNEFDWETWVSKWRAGHPKTFSGEPASMPSCRRTKFYDESGPEAADWPHYYYDVTCGGIDLKGTGRYKPNGEHYLDWDWHKKELGFHGVYKTQKLDKFQTWFPPITGRCTPSLWSNTGYGSFRQRPPLCNEFFRESDLFTKNQEQAKSIRDYPPDAAFDPALAKVVQGTRMRLKSPKEGGGVGGIRQTFDYHYFNDHVATESKMECDFVKALNEEWPECPFIGPQPYTPQPTGGELTEAQLEEQNWKEEARLEFKETNAYRKGMLVSESPYTLYIWDSRLIHGVFMTMLAMFVNPVSFFITRYFKETFMDSRLFYLHLWYFVHVSGSVITQLLFLVGLLRQNQSTGLLGVSLTRNGWWHRGMGWTAVAISLFLLFFGGFRTMNRKMRAVTLIIHWAAGTGFYIICFACIITSVFIPASPAAYRDVTIHHFATLQLYQEPVFLIAVLWITFDIIMHLIMTLLQRSNDKKMALTFPRYYFLSPIPVIAENFRFDTPGRFPRIYALRVYVVVAFIATVTMIFFIIHHSPRGRGLGHMTCTHIGPERDVREVFGSC